jgi:NitT/TauT family transport system substrate-binding protein
MKKTVLCSLITVIVMLASCSARSPKEQKVEQVHPLRIAEQFGLAYAPVTIARGLGFIEEELEALPLSGEGAVPLQWLRLGNTASIREAALAGRVDAAFMGIPPFLISRGGGMKWKIAAALNQSPLGLVTWRDDLRSLEDFSGGDRIALPQPGSIQHILLAMAAERTMGAADIFDRQLVTLSHPDGMQALLARREVAAHFTSPPYLFLELREPDMHTVLSGEECFGGPFTFIITVATEELALERPEVLQALLKGLERGMEYLSLEPEKSAEILSNLYRMETEDVLAMLRDPALLYRDEVLGLQQFIDFMIRTAYLPQDFPGAESHYWSTGSFDSAKEGL